MPPPISESSELSVGNSLLVDQNELLTATALSELSTASSSLIDESELPTLESEPDGLDVRESSRPLAVESELPDQTSAGEEIEEALAPQPAPLQQRHLASRLGVSEAALRRNRQDDSFADWTQSNDPEGIAWEYRPALKGLPQYYPVSNSTWNAKVESFLKEVSRRG